MGILCAFYFDMVVTYKVFYLRSLKVDNDYNRSPNNIVRVIFFKHLKEILTLN